MPCALTVLCLCSHGLNINNEPVVRAEGGSSASGFSFINCAASFAHLHRLELDSLTVCLLDEFADILFLLSCRTNTTKSGKRINEAGKIEKAICYF